MGRGSTGSGVRRGWWAGKTVCLLSTVGITSPTVLGEQRPNTPTCPGTSGTPSLSPPWQPGETLPTRSNKSGNLFPFKAKLIVAQEWMRGLQTSQWLRLEELALGKQTGAAATSLCVMLHSQRDFWNPGSVLAARRSRGKPAHCILPVSNYIFHILFISSKGTSNYYTMLSPTPIWKIYQL